MLAVLGLVILILLIVLLVPLRLNVAARYDEEVKARVHVTWLLRAVHVKLEWLKDHGLLRARLLGLKTLMKKHIGDWGPEPQKAEEPPGEPEEAAAESGTAAAEAEEKPASTEEGSAASGTEEKPAAAEAPASSEEKPAAAEEKPQTAEEKPSSAEEKPSPAEEKPASTSKPEAKEEPAEPADEKAGEAASAAQETASGTEEKEPAGEPEEDLPQFAATEKKLDEIAGKIDEFQGYWYDEKNRKTVRLIGKQLKKIGRHLKPTHFLVEGELGFGDPAKTGKIMGTLYSFYPVFRDHIRIDGNYEEQVMKLRLELKGRLRLGIFVEVALRLLLNKNLRHWIKKLTHKDKNEKAGEETAKETAEAADQEQKAA